MNSIWATPPAQVARYRPVAPARVIAPRSCEELGICQNRTPACRAQCAAPCGPDDDLDPDNPDQESAWDVIANGAALLMAGTMSLAFFGATAGYIYGNWVL